MGDRSCASSTNRCANGCFTPRSSWLARSRIATSSRSSSGRRPRCAGRRCRSRRACSGRPRRRPSAPSTRRTPSGRSLSTVRWPASARAHRGPVHVGPRRAAVLRAIASCAAVLHSRGRSRGSRASTAATRSVMSRCASTTSRSETGISAASRSSASSRPRSVSRSAHSSTAARESACPRTPRQALELVQQRGVALDARDGGTASSTTSARSQGIRRAARAPASSAKVMTRRLRRPATAAAGRCTPPARRRT